MDPFSITVGIAGLVTAAAGACKLAKVIHELNHDIKGAGSEIGELANAVEDYGVLVSLAYIAIKTHLSSDQSLSPVALHLHRTKIMKRQTIQSKGVIRKIKDQLPNIQSLKNRSKLVVGIKWAFRKDYVLALRPEMECSKLSLSLVMHCLSVQALRSQPASTTRDKQM